MAKQPPGLDHEPAPDALTGFASLMPPPAPKKPGPVGKAVRLPFRILALPFRLVAAVAKAPARRRSGSRGDEATD